MPKKNRKGYTQILKTEDIKNLYRVRIPAQLVIGRFGDKQGKIDLEDIIKCMKKLSTAHNVLKLRKISVKKLLLVAPATNNVNEHFRLECRRTKMYLRKLPPGRGRTVEPVIAPA